MRDTASPTPTSPLDHPWNEVEIDLMYLDNGQVRSRHVKILRSEVEAEEQAQYWAQLETMEDPTEEDIAFVENHTLSPEKFQERIVKNIDTMSSSPLRLLGEAPNEFRILPPWAVKEVRVWVNPSTQTLVLPRE